MTGSARRSTTITSWVAAGVFGAGLVLWWLVSPHEPNQVDLGVRLSAPSVTHPLGTDQLGRDVATRVAHGAIVTLGIAAGVHLVGAAIGTAIGMALAWWGGRVARVGTAAMDTLVAVPEVVVAFAVVAVIGPGVGGLMVAVLATAWLAFARTAHQVTVRILQQGYVEASVSLGAGGLRVLAGTVAPNAARPLLAHLCLRFPAKLVLVTGLAFLGLGPQPPSPEWGAMLAQGMAYLERNPVPTLAPGLCIVIVGVVVGSLGRELEDQLDR